MQLVYDTSGCSSQGFSWSPSNRYLNRAKLAKQDYVTTILFIEVLNTAMYTPCLAVNNAGYSGDVWDQQPAPKDHPWRHMRNQAMTPHTSGTTLDAQVGSCAHHSITQPTF